MAAYIFSCLLLLFLSCAANSTPKTSFNQVNDHLISSRLVSSAAVEKQSHFRFYYHDNYSQTAVPVAQGPGTNTSATSFGVVVMMDDPLTVGPDIKSKLVGRAHGIYASAALDKWGLLMVMNLVFTDGEYNGSTLAILGHNEIYSAVREMPIVGGTGLFRFARGYMQARTYYFVRPIAIVEFDVFVNHY